MNNLGLVEHCKLALKEHWGYVYGTFGIPLTETMLQYKATTYPGYVKPYKAFIVDNYMGKRVVDCVGLIKSYLWWNKGEVSYDKTTDYSANGMYQKSIENGKIDTIPEIAGICVWKHGHIGVYVGNGLVIESHSTKSGVIQTPLLGKGSTPWTHWLKCPLIDYIIVDGIRYGDNGNDVKWLQRKLNVLGYGLEEDGKFGDKTLESVKNFQRYNGLSQTGIVSEEDMKAIDYIVNKMTGTPSMSWRDIIRVHSNRPDVWIAELEKLIESGGLFEYLPQLIEKIYYKK